MLEDLTPEQRALAELMEELSELAYCATWMGTLEVALWEMVLGRRRRFGRLEISAEQLERLRALAAACGGWIVFDRQREETFVPRAEWERRFAVAEPPLD
ncbi:MAG: hypothetical protein JNM84_15075 [Planctomycetes bacterium]|nr:hypothetical protein [Planctomycetota bacterium]